MFPTMVTGSAGPFVAFPRAAIEQSIAARFEEQAARHGDRLAVRTATESLTYRQLDAWANRLAHGILARRGNDPEPIGLLMSQGAPLVAAILGILKAGKMYVPMDPSHPQGRNACTLEDAGVALIITDRADPAAAPIQESSARSVMPIDELGFGHPEQAPHLPLSGDTLAYVYYTSGSTGRPKGVFDTHRNVLHNIMRYSNSLQICPLDRLTLLQSPSFSGAVSSLFSALLNGAAVFPYDVAREGMGRSLASWLVREQITIYHSVPMIFRSIAHGQGPFPSIRIIRLEGDAASRVDVELYRRHFEPGCVLVNGLGATETGITRQFFMSRETPLPHGIVPIGYATEDMHALLLDDGGQEVGVGPVGQIAIRSRYLASGYWRQPELTRAAFLPGPAGSGERIYLTGDLGRFQPDGCLEYLGRQGAGLKIRGHRVEPAEVERALLTLDAIREAAVVSGTDPRGNGRLVAYLVPAGRPPVPVPVLRRALAGTLPDYMIPTRFVFLDQLPLSENGKVDRAALPAPGEGQVERATAYVPPRDPLEERLVGIWEELLNTQPVGVTDNFFDLGGDSLLAASLVLSLEQITTKELPATTIVTAPTIEQLANVIRGGLSQRRDVLVPLRTGGTRPPFFCAVEHGGGVGAGFAALSRRLGADQPFYALQSAGLSGDEPPLTSIEAMAARYLEAVRGVQPHGPYYLGGRCFGGVVALEMAHQLIAQGDAVGLIFLLHVTPEDFPGLVAEPARRRFRRHRLMELLRSEVEKISQRRMWKRGPYLIREIGRKAWARGGELTLRWLIRRGYPLPRPLRAVGLVNRQAFALHIPRAFPGRLTLVLRAEHASMYASDPARDWGRLATGGYDVHYLESSPWGFSQEPQPRLIADLLRAALPAGAVAVRT
jgi:amino acid adenylation domain-containing protein